MPHNRPQRVIQTEVMAAPAEWFAGWHLAVDCRSDRCPVGRHHAIDRLLEHRRGKSAVGDLVDGLRCAGCGERPARVALVERLPERTGGRVFRLVGPGAWG